GLGSNRQSGGRDLSDSRSLEAADATATRSLHRLRLCGALALPPEPPGELRCGGPVWTLQRSPGRTPTAYDAGLIAEGKSCRVRNADSSSGLQKPVMGRWPWPPPA